MKAIGVIVEYNPFHNGHKYHLKKAREVTGADVVIAVMSGDFTQRGEVACFSRWKRTEMALENGIDMVVELPAFYSSQSAEIFAEGAVKILSQLDVDAIVFGSESSDIKNLEKIAVLEESIDFKKNLEWELKNGLSYPSAYSAALQKSGANFTIKSNDILGIEYLKAIKKTGKEIQAIPIQRIGAGYHDIHAQGEIASATGIRRMFRENEKLEKFIPEESKIHMSGEKMALLEEYYPLIRYEIINNFEKIGKIQDVAEGFENRIFELAMKYKDFNEFFSEMITKRYTIGRLQRILIHILIGLTSELTADARKNLPYVRILGFNGKGRMYLKKLKETGDSTIKRATILTGLKNIQKILTERERELLEFNERASLIYRMINFYEDRKNLIIK